MPTYTQLLAEAVWRAQFVPPLLDSVLIRPLRSFYGLGPTAVGAPGDNNHLYGRHRSANWDRTSIYCTNRSYGTTDARDKRGDQDWYRAVDIGITGQRLYDASHRLDNAVRSGRLPGVAEWFGTFDGVHVVGWYEGHPSSSDSSHLYHCHVGLWNQFANDEATLRAVYATVTGTGDDFMATIDQAQWDSLIWRVDALFANRPTAAGGPYAGETNMLAAKLAEIDAQIEALAATGGGGGGGLTYDQAVQAAKEGANLAEDS